MLCAWMSGCGHYGPKFVLFDIHINLTNIGTGMHFIATL